MTEKRCFKCGEVKPIDEFYKHPQMADGHVNKCKDCARAERKRHEIEHPDAILESRLKQCAKKPTRTNAHRVVEAAVAAGKLVKPHVCSACGCDDSEHRMEAHHHDYSKPLDVIWLCTPCHRRADMARRAHEGDGVTGRSKSVSLSIGGSRICRFDTMGEAAAALGCTIHALRDAIASKSIINGVVAAYA